MIFCKLKEKQEDRAIYLVGALISDMTGEAIFFKGGEKYPVLSKQAEKYPVFEHRLLQIYFKYYYNNFRNGVFPEKMGNEIG